MATIIKINPSCLSDSFFILLIFKHYPVDNSKILRNKLTFNKFLCYNIVMITSSSLSAGQGQLEGFEHLGSSHEIATPPLLDGQQWHTALEVAVDYAERLEENDGLTENKPKLSVIFVDVDRLKEVNDNFGHEVGDMVIKAVTTTAQVLNAQNNITAGRIGGDEFALFAWSKDDNESTGLSNKLNKNWRNSQKIMKRACSSILV